MWRCQPARFFFVNNNNKQCTRTNRCNNNDARVIKISLWLSIAQSFRHCAVPKRQRSATCFVFAQTKRVLDLACSPLTRAKKRQLHSNSWPAYLFAHCRRCRHIGFRARVVCFVFARATGQSKSGGSETRGILDEFIWFSNQFLPGFALQSCTALNAHKLSSVVAAVLCNRYRQQKSAARKKEEINLVQVGHPDSRTAGSTAARTNCVLKESMARFRPFLESWCRNVTSWMVFPPSPLLLCHPLAGSTLLGGNSSQVHAL